MSMTLLESTVKSVFFNVIFQILVKGITFILNAFVLRFITQEVLGVMNVRLLLLESTILFVSREAFRRTALSQRESCTWQQIINLVWLMVPLSLLVSFLFSLVWLHLLHIPSTDITPHYSVGVWSISLSCLIEILAEPPYIVAQAYLFIKLKIFLAALVVLLRIMIFLPWIIMYPHDAVIAFSAAQIIANIAYSSSYYFFFYCYIKNQNFSKGKIKLDHSTADKCDHFMLRNKCKQEGVSVEDFQKDELPEQQETVNASNQDFPFSSITDFFPHVADTQKWIHPNSLHLTWSFLKQGILKQILTEGERYVMTLFSVLTFKEQGIYDIVSNLGSLIVRFVFRPIEESLYFYFTQTMKRDTYVIKQNQKNMQEVAKVLHQSLNCVLDIGLLIFTFGQSYSTLLLYLYGGKTISAGQGPNLLRAHTFSVILLAINGVTECYAFSTMSAEQVNKHNYLLAVFSITFLLVSWSSTKLLGSLGFIVANCCNMLARIFHSILYIKKLYTGTQMKPLSGLVPTKYYSTSLCVSFVITKFSEVYCDNIQHFFVGVICFIVVATAWSFERRTLLQIALQKWHQMKLKKDI